MCEMVQIFIAVLADALRPAADYSKFEFSKADAGALIDLSRTHTNQWERYIKE